MNGAGGDGPDENGTGAPIRTARVRCPSPQCARVLELLPEWLGRNMYCPACGARMTARPLAVEEELQEREGQVVGRCGTEHPRLPLVVLVDNVRSLWNVGSIFRTADACGVREVILAGISGCPPRPEISKTALGAEQVVAWSYHADPISALAHWAGRGYEAVALETTERAIPVERMRWPERVCLVLGNEVAGISDEVLRDCSRQVRIPMHGVKNTLNVAVAFGIAAHHASSALRRSAPAGSASDPG